VAGGIFAQKVAHQRQMTFGQLLEAGVIEGNEVICDMSDKALPAYVALKLKVV
jgi:hypothetical protein